MKAGREPGEPCAPAKPPQIGSTSIWWQQWKAAMRHRSEAAEGWIGGRFKTDFVPPAISPVIALLSAFGACYQGFSPLFRCYDHKM